MSKYNVTIGLEMHCEITNTNTKVFSQAKNDYSNIPNINVNAVDMAFPGVLPVLNKECVKHSILMASILNCKIPEYLVFERKNYYYPDLPKGYQITQNTKPYPIGQDGFIDIIRSDGSTFRVLIDNIHLEEDSASMTHLYDTSLIDYNRAGVPLLELVTAPCIHNADDAISFLEYIRSVYQYANISEADSKKGHIRCDVNISISKDDTLGTKVEIKNVNSFKNVKEVINYEIKRQTELMDAERYDEIVQETRRWDEESGTTIRMRSKVDAIDYKYFVEPNIPIIKIDPDWILDIKKNIPELPYERKNKYINEYNLSDIDANTLIKDKNISDYFDECIKLGINAKTASNWITGNILGYIYQNDLNINELYISPKMLKDIIDNIESGKISSKQAKEVFNYCLEEKKKPNDIIKEKGLIQNSNEDELLSMLTEILDNSEEQIAAYKNGKTNMFQYFVGQMMKQTKGQANPVVVSKLLTKELKKR